MRQTKIAIIGTDLMKWGGGIDFLVDFIKIFELHPEKYYCEVFLPKKTFIESIIRFILGKRNYFNNLERITKCLQLECPEIPILKYLDRFWSRKQRYKNVKEIAISEKVDFLMPMSLIMNGIDDESYITIAYIYDFQHKHLPDFFDKKEIVERDKYFENILRCYDFAFTQSYDSLKDIRDYYGDLARKVYVMYAYPHKIIYKDNYKVDIKKKYNVDKPYFIVCNQFWIHKNHKIVFEALEILFKKGYSDVMVVCTGETSDYRFPDYFASIIDYINGLNCKDNIKILGYIDKEDQIFLLNHSISLIQPTLFEGNPGGGAVVDAEAYGVPCIVSNIPVNLEIPDCYNISYFDSNSAFSLADRMEEAVEGKNKDFVFNGRIDYEQFFICYDKVITDMKRRFLIEKRKV